MVASWKIEYVNNLKEMLRNQEIFAIANAMDLPSKAFQEIRRKLGDSVQIKVVRKRLLIKALEELVKTKPELQKIIEELENQKRITVTILIPKDSDLNSFKLYRLLEENKSYRKARPGDIAPEDIVIKAGPTSFTPGPVVSELSKYGLKVAIEGGKVVVKEDKVVARKGEEITPDKAELLSKFGLEPIEVKLAILLSYEKGLIYTQDILAIDPQEYVNMLRNAFMHALNLSLKIGLPTKDNIEILIRNAFQDAVKLSLKTGLPTKDTIKLLLTRAISSAIALSQYLPEEHRPVKIETTTQEEKKEEEKPKEEKKEEKQEEGTQQALEGLSSLFGF